MRELYKTPVFAYYDTQASLIVSADAPSGVSELYSKKRFTRKQNTSYVYIMILDEHREALRSSRIGSPCKHGACVHFRMYLIRPRFQIETDTKPSVRCSL